MLWTALGGSFYCRRAGVPPGYYSRIKKGSLAEQITERYRKEQAIEPILADMAHCLRANVPDGME